MIALSDDVRYGKSPITGNWYKVTDYEEVDGHPERIIADRKIPVDESDVPETAKQAHEIAEEDRIKSDTGGE